MVKKIKRRQFGQLAAGSLTATLVADLSAKVFAQNNQQEFAYGVNLLNPSQVKDRENDTPPLEFIETDVRTEQIFFRTNIPSQKVENLEALPKKNKAFFLPDFYRVSAMNTLRDGTIAIATVSYTKKGNSNQLILITGKKNKIKVKAKKIKGLDNPEQTVESLCSVPNNPNQLLFIVGYEGTPPFSFKLFNLTNNKIISEDSLSLPPLSPIHRVANLTLAPNGEIFATETGPEGPTLISLNLENKSQISGKVLINRLNSLSFQNRPLVNDLKSLSFSSTGKLYSLSSEQSQTDNALFEVNLRNGKLEQVKKINVEKLTLSP